MPMRNRGNQQRHEKRGAAEDERDRRDRFLRRAPAKEAIDGRPRQGKNRDEPEIRFGVIT
jgi:hypothetical protein